MLWLVQGLDANARELLTQLREEVGDEPISAACVALAEYAVDPDLARARQADLAERFDQLRDVLPLLARIHAEILARTADSPARYQAWLAETGQGIADRVHPN